MDKNIILKFNYDNWGKALKKMNVWVKTRFFSLDWVSKYKKQNISFILVLIILL